MESMQVALTHLGERKKFYMDQINSYNSYVDAALQTMQKGKG
jgi:Ras GTPase-activating-like protein IQGAP2/3